MKIEWKRDVCLEVVKGMHDDCTPSISRRTFRKGERTDIMRYQAHAGKFDLDLNEDDSIFGVSEDLFEIVKGD